MFDDEMTTRAWRPMQCKENLLDRSTPCIQPINRDKLIADLASVKACLLRWSQIGFPDKAAHKKTPGTAHQCDRDLVKIMGVGFCLLLPIAQPVWKIEGELERLQRIAAEPSDDGRLQRRRQSNPSLD